MSNGCGNCNSTSVRVECVGSNFVSFRLFQIPQGSLLLRSTNLQDLDLSQPPNLYCRDILKIPLPTGSCPFRDDVDLCPNTRYYYALASACGSEWLGSRSIITAVTEPRGPEIISASMNATCFDAFGSAFDFVFRPQQPLVDIQTYSLVISRNTSILITVNPSTFPQVTLTQTGATNPGATYSATFRADGTVRIIILGITAFGIPSSGLRATFYRIASNGVPISAPTAILVSPPTTATSCSVLFGAVGPFIPL